MAALTGRVWMVLPEQLPASLAVVIRWVGEAQVAWAWVARWVAVAGKRVDKEYCCKHLAQGNK